jgi:hypothetical protein
MPTGYIPARKNPVKNLKRRISEELIVFKQIPRLKSPAKNELKKKTLEGEKRSDIVSIA